MADVTVSTTTSDSYAPKTVLPERYGGDSGANWWKSSVPEDMRSVTKGIVVVGSVAEQEEPEAIAAASNLGSQATG
jgi:hypothetical protein